MCSIYIGGEINSVVALNGVVDVNAQTLATKAGQYHSVEI